MKTIRDIILWFMLVVMLIIGNENIFIDIMALTILSITGLIILCDEEKRSK